MHIKIFFKYKIYRKNTGLKNVKLQKRDLVVVVIYIHHQFLKEKKFQA